MGAPFGGKKKKLSSPSDIKGEDPRDPNKDLFAEEKAALRRQVGSADETHLSSKDRTRFFSQLDSLRDDAGVDSVIKLREEFETVLGRGKDIRQKFKAISASIADRPGISGTFGGGKGILG